MHHVWLVRVVWLWLALVVWVVPAAAEPGFVWEAPATCPDAAEVRRRIELRLGMPLDGSVHGIEVAIARNGRDFVARIDTRGVTVANQIRTLTSARCDELTDAVAVIIVRLASEWRRVERRVAVVDRESPLATREIAAPATEPAEAGKWGGGLRMLALSGIGAIPRVGIGGELAGYVRRHDHFAELAGARWAARPRYLVPGAPGRVDVSLDTIALRVGWGPGDMPIRAWLGVEVGMMEGAGMALEDPRVGTGRWIAAGGGFGVGWPMSPRARLVGIFETVVPFERVRFVLAQGGEIYQPAVLSARFAIGLELGWP